MIMSNIPPENSNPYTGAAGGNPPVNQPNNDVPPVPQPPQYGQGQPQPQAPQNGWVDGQAYPQNPSQPQHPQVYQAGSYQQPPTGWNPPPRDPNQPGAYNNGGYPPQPPKKSNVGLIVGLVAGGIVLIIFVILVIAGLSIASINRADDNRPAPVPSASETTTPKKTGVDLSFGGSGLPVGKKGAMFELLNASSDGWEKQDSPTKGAELYKNASNGCTLITYQTYISDVEPVAGDDEATTYNMFPVVSEGAITAEEAQTQTTNESVQLADGSGAVEFKAMSGKTSTGYSVYLARAFVDSNTGDFVALTCGDEASAQKAWDSVKDKLVLTLI